MAVAADAWPTSHQDHFRVLSSPQLWGAACQPLPSRGCSLPCSSLPPVLSKFAHLLAGQPAGVSVNASRGNSQPRWRAKHQSPNFPIPSGATLPHRLHSCSHDLLGPELQVTVCSNLFCLNFKIIMLNMLKYIKDKIGNFDRELEIMV